MSALCKSLGSAGVPGVYFLGHFQRSGFISMEPADRLGAQPCCDGDEGQFPPYIVLLLEVLTLLTRLLLPDLSSLTFRLWPFQDHYQTISGFQWPNAQKPGPPARAFSA